ncbi:hypothetical protein CEH05_07560 [Halobacillus halophilus]|uniref:Cytochrome c oxidase subunit 4 n=1 Tax=Halobacillus halophilus (strain ATCC 35676 / DSM 2266 / JCM 20832 / KCTC 3685 / LMG 17431 / NBRC 102448 / NCIMB 2269) TaxID=866895 RepID=I0JL30_HALH3|nr:hypothetical protein [Halobacillus halophilus]ASF38975.1 hypothetical protein CEH05_07560 [Halobacillus halophilus]CCG44850.1 conserved hypothetical protein [Halobacillus halophilus DSM 2266]
MFDAGWLNIGSLVLGLVAWIIPIVNLALGKKQMNKKWIALTIISFSACAIAICLQIFYNLHLVNIEDWSALLEMHGVAVISTVLVIVTILLNTSTLFLYRDRGAL